MSERIILPSTQSPISFHLTLLSIDSTVFPRQNRLYFHAFKKNNYSRRFSCIVFYVYLSTDRYFISITRSSCILPMCTKLKFTSLVIIFVFPRRFFNHSCVHVEVIWLHEKIRLYWKSVEYDGSAYLLCKTFLIFYNLKNF